YVLASLLCWLAIHPARLIAARFLQGATSARASVLVLSMVVALFPDAGARTRATCVYAYGGAARAESGTLPGRGPPGSGGWRRFFLVNVPIGVAAVLLTLRYVAADPPTDRSARPDVLGGLLVTAGTALTVFAIVDTSAVGVRLGTAAVALALLAGFVARQRRAADPLVRLGIFRSRALSGGNAA